MARVALGSPRGVTLAVLSASLALGLAAAAPLLYVLLSGRWELAALAVDPVRAAWALDLNKFPFHEEATSSGRTALAAAFMGQTRIAALGLCAIAIYFAWRGYANHRPRGWGPFFWVSTVCLLFFAPAALPKLSVQRADYAVSAVLGAAHASERPSAKPRPLQAAVLPLKLDPATVLAIRAALAALAAAFLSLACHDAAYRLREAFIEFGLTEAESERPEALGADQTAEEKPRRVSGKGSRRARPEAVEKDTGRRTRARKALPPGDPRARASEVLGLPAGATRAEVEKAFRAKIKRAHPDHGGSAEQAAALNDARQLLLSQG